MANKSIIKDLTKQEACFLAAAKMMGKNLSTGDARFYMKLTEMVNEDENMRIADVTGLYRDVYENEH